MFLIWRMGLRGPSISKVLALHTDGTGKPIEVLEKHPLTAEQFALPLNVLQQFFPPPVQR